MVLKEVGKLLLELEKAELEVCIQNNFTLFVKEIKELSFPFSKKKKNKQKFFLT